MFQLYKMLAVEYIDWVSQQKSKISLPANKCPGYDIKPSDDEVPALEIWWIVEYPFIAIAPKSIQT